jgi:hypothetical protein
VRAEHAAGCSPSPSVSRRTRATDGKANTESQAKPTLARKMESPPSLLVKTSLKSDALQLLLGLAPARLMILLPRPSQFNACPCPKELLHARQAANKLRLVQPEGRARLSRVRGWSLGRVA